MKKIAIVASCLIALLGCNDNESTSATPIFSQIDSWEMDIDDSHIQPLRDEIVGKNYFSLGEFNHGTGTAYSAKNRIIKTLHQHADANVIAFESGLWDGLRLWQKYMDGEIVDLQQGSLYSFFYMYSETAEVFPLFRYIEQHALSERPLYLVGFDGRHSSDPACSEMIPELQIFSENNLNVEMDWDWFVQTSHEMQCPWYHVPPDWNEHDPLPLPSEAVQTQYRGYLDTLELALSEMKLSQTLPAIKERGDFRQYATVWLQVVKSLRAQTVQRWQGLYDSDDQMQADNLIWLQTEWFPDETIMAWGHNSHVGRHPDYGNFDAKPAFHYLEQRKPDETFVMLQTAHRGEYRFTMADPEYRQLTYHYDAPTRSVESRLVSEGISNAILLTRELDALPEHLTLIEYPLDEAREMADAIIFIANDQPGTIITPR